MKVSVVNLAAKYVPEGRGGVAIMLCRLLPSAAASELGPDEMPVRCFVRSAGAARYDSSSCSAGLTAEDLRVAAEARNLRVDAPGSLSVGAYLAWGGSITVDARERRIFLRLCASYPRWSFKLTLLAVPLRTHETPLLIQLLSPHRHTNMGYGFLTLDLGRSAVCLLETDELVQRIPVVGVWVDLLHCQGSGDAAAAAWWDAAEVVDHPLVWTAAARFVHSSRLKERVWVDEATFLVMAVHSTSASAQTGAEICVSFFESRYDSSAADAAYLVPAHEVAVFDADAAPEDGEDFVILDVRSLSLAEVLETSGRSENPEEDVPPQGPQPSVRQLPTVTSSLELPRTAAPRPYPGHAQQAVPAATPATYVPFAVSKRPNPPQPEDLPGKLGFGRQSRAPKVQDAFQAERHAKEPELAGGGAAVWEPRHFASRPLPAAPSKQEIEGAAVLRLVSLQQAQLSEMKEQIANLHALVSQLTSVPAAEETRRSSGDAGAGTVTVQPATGSTRGGLETCLADVGSSGALHGLATRSDVAVNVGDSLSLHSLDLRPKPDTRRDVAVGTSLDFQVRAVSTEPAADSKRSVATLREATQPAAVVTAPTGKASQGAATAAMQSFEADKAELEEESSHSSEFLLVVPGADTVTGTSTSSMGVLRDSADTAGGATPRKSSLPLTWANVTAPSLRTGQCASGVGIVFPDDIPRIICPSSPSLSSSDLSLDDGDPDAPDAAMMLRLGAW